MADMSVSTKGLAMINCICFGEIFCNALEVKEFLLFQTVLLG